MRPALLILPLLTPVALVACSASPPPDADGAVTVSSSDSACDVSATTIPAGPTTFSVTNTGNQVTEFYLLREDGQAIVSEVENIGPGITRDLVIQAQPGTYVTACKPGMTGDGIRAEFTVTGDATTTGDTTAEVTAATTTYTRYVKEQTAQLVAGTKQFADAYVAGDDKQARELYAPTRAYWESIEPVAESFGDLDPRLDLREADLEEGQVWTGWHRIEKDLWPPSGYRALTEQQRQKLADQLVADTRELADRVDTLELSIDQIGNGAKELLDEVATGKVTGEEEYWSHTDLYDFAANVAGAKVMVNAVRPILVEKDPALATKLDERFAQLQKTLDRYRDGDGYVSYTDLTPQQVKELAAQVDALGEPLSQVTAVVLR
ncbi:MAG: iron uptake system protein EfeO [Candidatus Nanopelagicales bacterium]